MITLTLEKPTKLSKSHFHDIEELFDEYRKMSLENSDYVEVGKLSKKEVADDMKKKIEWAKTLPNTAFTNI